MRTYVAIYDVLPSANAHQVPTTSVGVGQPALTMPLWSIMAWQLEAGGQPQEEAPTTFACHTTHSTSATAEDIKATKAYTELNMSFGTVLHIETFTTTMFRALSAL